MVNIASRLLSGVEKRARNFRNSQQHQQYLNGAREPWTPGYHTEKVKVITQATSDINWDPLSLPAKHGFRLDERTVEYPWFFAQLPAGGGKLLDAGSVLNFEYLVNNPKITEKKLSISTLGPESHAFWKQGVNYVFEDLRDSCFRDNYFDWVCCLSTLEHIGLDNTRFVPGDDSKLESDPESCLKAVREFKRILKPGGRLFLTVPYGKAKNHKWFQIFDSSMIDKVIAEFAPSEQKEVVYRYKPDGWTISDRKAAENETYFDIHEQSDYDSDYAAASRAVICVELVR